MNLKNYPNIEPIEDLYYVKLPADDYRDVYMAIDLVYSVRFWKKDNIERDNKYKTKFTMREIKDLGEKEGKDFMQFAVKVEE